MPKARRAEGTDDDHDGSDDDDDAVIFDTRGGEWSPASKFFFELTGVRYSPGSLRQMARDAELHDLAGVDGPKFIVRKGRRSLTRGSLKNYAQVVLAKRQMREGRRRLLELQGDILRREYLREYRRKESRMRRRVLAARSESRSP